MARAARGVAAPGAVTPDRSFFARSSLAVARDLLGGVLVHESAEGRTAGRIVEVEAYRGPKDRAAHSFGGRRTARNEVMYGPPGHAYVYFVYGMHDCVNVVTAAVDVPEAVLLRALEPLEGIELMRRRRGLGAAAAEHLLCRGPGNLCRAMGIDRRLNGADLLDGALRLEAAPRLPAALVGRGPRIGVAYAGADAALPWRLAVRASAALSVKLP
jgi:DNA-3-methyladenine glycosylase